MKFQEIWQNVRILNIPRLTVLDLGLANQEIKVLICSSPKIGWLGLLDTNPIQDIFREKKKKISGEAYIWRDRTKMRKSVRLNASCSWNPEISVIPKFVGSVV